jgi:hypothetical protein
MLQPIIHLGDINGDGKVDILDIALVARSFATVPCSPKWNPIADTNGDGVINIMDIAAAARLFGKNHS